MINQDDWEGLYGEGWQNEIVPEAFSHPAKFSRALIRRIYDHAMSEGWLKLGDHVLDPFGGVSLGALDAMRLGLDWTGVELEPKFVDLGNQNIEQWLKRYAPHFPVWGTARLMQGDSRELLALVGQADAVVSSPPYSNSMTAGGHLVWNDQGKIGAHKESKGLEEIYGSTDGNLGNLRGTAAGYAAAVSSPPYSSTEIAIGLKSGADIDERKGKRKDGNWEGCGSTPGQLGAMPARGYEAAVSSPPFEQSLPSGDTSSTFKAKYPDAQTGGDWGQSYGDTSGNLGNSMVGDFWVAARAIVDQVYGALVPGGHAIWVVKDYVKAGKRVSFSEQWAAMCAAAGFELLHWHRAWLVEDKGTQIDLWGNGHNKKVERKSFFRRLAEKKGSPRIDFESVLCMRKP